MRYLRYLSRVASLLGLIRFDLSSYRGPNSRRMRQLEHDLARRLTRRFAERRPPG